MPVEFQLTSFPELHQGTKRKSIDKNVEVVIANNTYGMFVWESRNGETSLFMEERGDEEFVSYGELRRLKKHLANMDLIIKEVDDDDISIMDIARGLRIEETYKKYFQLVCDLDEDDAELERDIEVEDFDDFILDSDIESFRESLDSPLEKAVVAGSVELYKERKLADREKTHLIKMLRPKEEQGDFWADIEASYD